MKHNEIIYLLLGILIGIVLCTIVVANKWEHHNTIIKHECGQYNSKTSDFEWLEK